MNQLVEVCGRPEASRLDNGPKPTASGASAASDLDRHCPDVRQHVGDPARVAWPPDQASAREALAPMRKPRHRWMPRRLRLDC